MTEHHTQFPDLSGVKQISLDLETHDPNLKTRGCGGVRGDGEVLGFALAWHEASPTPLFGLAPGVQSVYLPIAHAVGNLDRSKVLDYLDNVLGRGIPVVGASIAYDLEWCAQVGLKVTGQKRDIQIAEALIDENKKSYKLETLAMDYLGEGKLSEEMFAKGAVKLGCKPAEVISNLRRLPAEDVADYARTDAELTLKIMELQAPMLEALKLHTVWNLECDLVDVLQEMRWLGIRFDVDRAKLLQAQLSSDELVHKQALVELTGEEISPWSHDVIQAAATKLGLKGLVVDAEGKQSFPAPWLVDQPDPFFQHLLQLRQLSKAGGAFLQSFLDFQHNGRIHCNYHQTRNEHGGTKSGRLSCSLPNLQQIPNRNEKLAPRIRALFLPEEGERLVSFDMSQIELRLMLHYSNALNLPGAEEAVEAYTEQAGTDYYAALSETLGISRFAAKQIFLALSYGAGKAKIAELLGMTVEETTLLFEKVNHSSPYLKMLRKACQSVAEGRGYITTALKRRRNFNLWGPRKYKPGMLPLHREEAIEKWGAAVTRWFTFRAGNSLMQGTASDIMKTNLVEVVRIAIPLITVHDELVFSLDKGARGDKMIREIKHVMEHPTGIALMIPLLVNVRTGPNLGGLVEWEG